LRASHHPEWPAWWLLHRGEGRGLGIGVAHRKGWGGVALRHTIRKPFHTRTEKSAKRNSLHGHLGLDLSHDRDQERSLQTTLRKEWLPKGPLQPTDSFDWLTLCFLNYELVPALKKKKKKKPGNFI